MKFGNSQVSLHIPCQILFVRQKARNIAIVRIYKVMEKILKYRIKNSLFTQYVLNTHRVIITEKRIVMEGTSLYFTVTNIIVRVEHSATI